MLFRCQIDITMTANVRRYGKIIYIMTIILPFLTVNIEITSLNTPIDNSIHK